MGGAISESTERNFTGVGRRHPVISLIAPFRVGSSFLVCVLLLQTGNAYSAALNKRAKVLVRRVLALEPQEVPARLAAEEIDPRRCFGSERF